MTESQEDALRRLCAAPMATVKELAHFGRVPQSTLRDQLNRLAALGLVDSVSHRLDSLSTRLQRRYFPTAARVMTQQAVERVPAHQVQLQMVRFPQTFLAGSFVQHRLTSLR